MAEPLARGVARRPRRSCARRPAAACAALALAGTWAVLGGPGPADAARLVDVRVGRHPDFVRVVFETDSPAAFSVEAGEAPDERRIRIEAAGGAGAVRVPPGVGAEVTLEPLPDGATLARIRAAGPVRVESQVLDRPPRIVFDLRPGAPEPPLAALEAAPAEAPRTGAGPLREEPQPEAEEPEAEEPDAEEPEAAGQEGEPTESGAALLAPELQEPSVFPDLARPLAEPVPWLHAEARGEAAPPSALEPGATSAPPPEPEPEPRAAAPELPPVAAAPPGAVGRRLDGRSLLAGASAGLVVGLGVSLLRRGRRRAADGAARPAEPAPQPAASSESPASPAPAAPQPSPPPTGGPLVGPPSGDRLAEDVFAMLQRLDERLARVEGTLAALAERAARLEARSGLQAEELTAQRAALARLHLAFCPPPGAAGGRRPTAPLASAPRES
jgi:hypothetical protein